jgi:hypothetical protein
MSVGSAAHEFSDFEELKDVRVDVLGHLNYMRLYTITLRVSFQQHSKGVAPTTTYRSSLQASPTVNDRPLFPPAYASGRLLACFPLPVRLGPSWKGLWSEQVLSSPSLILFE